MNAFEMALKASNDEYVKEAANGLYSLYSELQKAGFTKSEAMTILTTLMGNDNKK